MKRKLTSSQTKICWGDKPSLYLSVQWYFEHCCIFFNRLNPTFFPIAKFKTQIKTQQRPPLHHSQTNYRLSLSISSSSSHLIVFKGCTWNNRTSKMKKHNRKSRDFLTFTCQLRKIVEKELVWSLAQWMCNMSNRIPPLVIANDPISWQRNIILENEFFFFFIKNCFNWCAYERPKERITKYRETLLLISVEPVSVSSFPLTIVICLTNIISIAVNYWCFCVFLLLSLRLFSSIPNLLYLLLFSNHQSAL